MFFRNFVKLFLTGHRVASLRAVSVAVKHRPS